MRPRKFKVKLSDSEKTFLDDFISNKGNSSRQIKRAHILLLSNENLYDKDICSRLSVNNATVYRIRKRFCEEGLNDALKDKIRSGANPKISEDDVKKIIELVRSNPPEKSKSWSIRLLVEQVYKQGIIEYKISREAIRLILKKHNIKLWTKKETDNQTEITIFNNSGSTIIVPDGVVKGESLIIEPGKKIKIHKLTNQLKKILEDGLIEIV